MKSIRNSVQLIGRLGKDPEVKTYNSRKKATFSLATNDSYKNQKGEKIEDTQWHNIAMWGKLAETAEQFLKKGMEIVVEGRLVHTTYETDKGEKKYYTDIDANDFLMVGDKKG